MIEFGGVVYYIDMLALDKMISPKNLKQSDDIVVTQKTKIIDESGTTIHTEIVETTNPRSKEVDITKYEIIRMMIETLIDYDDELDTALGIETALNKTPLSYKLAFNTLINYGILKEKE